MKRMIMNEKLKKSMIQCSEKRRSWNDIGIEFDFSA
jgi:hypothetical protein